MSNKQYTFDGAVYVFNRLVEARWTATTTAPTKAKAISNLKYRFRKLSGLVNNIPIVFEGHFTTI